MAPKKQAKQQKLALGDFLNDQSLGSWADEMDSQPLPATSSGFGASSRGFGSSSGFGGDRAGGFGSARTGGGFGDSARPAFRDNLPLPDKPPYTAHLGNLSFEVTQGDVQDFLSGCEVTSVRIVEDKLEMRPKGFGYVEFGSLEGLKKALTLSETQFQGRNIRISVAEPSQSRDGGREISDWTRKGPLPDLPGQGSGMRRGSDRVGGGGGFGRNYESGGSDAGGDRKPAFFEGDGKTRDFSNWERKGPLTPAAAPEPRQGGRTPRAEGAPFERRTSPAWGEGRSETSRPPRREFQERPPPERVPTAADQDSQWRTKMRPDAPSPAPTPDASTPSSPAIPSAPAGRPRLNLTKRTVSEAPKEAAADDSAPAEPKSSIFGAARPIDTSGREREIAEKRELAIRQKKEQDDKVRDEKRAKEAASKASRASVSKAETPKEVEPRENGSKTEGEEKEEAPAAPGRQYEILRRTNEAEAEEAEADPEGVDASANGDIIGDKEVKPQEITREVLKDGEGGEVQQSQETTAEQVEDDGWSTVPAKAKNGTRRAGQRAMAS